DKDAVTVRGQSDTPPGPLPIQVPRMARPLRTAAADQVTTNAARPTQDSPSPTRFAEGSLAAPRNPVGHNNDLIPLQLEAPEPATR
ncbi:MAG TPA: hypothetical protein VM452_18210, partial [Caulifigura sp.]|nr:hypothetical protein [Caulifigura sp.]